MVGSEYRTEYLSLAFYWIGWKWGYAIMKIKDSNNDIKIRLSKCKILEGFPETSMFEWEELDVSNLSYLTQVNHINFKKKQEVESCFLTLLEELEEGLIS